MTPEEDILRETLLEIAKFSKADQETIGKWAATFQKQVEEGGQGALIGFALAGAQIAAKRSTNETKG